MKQKQCEGVRTTGYWKGHRCCAIAKYESDGKWYCANHIPIRQRLIDAAKDTATTAITEELKRLGGV